MTAASWFKTAWRALPLATPADVTCREPFVVLSPHPDDESLGVGGLIAASAADGVDMRVVVVSDGSQSHPRSRRVPPDAMAALRRRECEVAVSALGLAVSKLLHLGLADTAVPASGPAFAAAVERLVALVDEIGARRVFAAWEYDPHCDHVAVAVMARALRQRRPELALWAYPIWGWHLDNDVEVDAPRPTGFRIDIEDWLSVKRRAIAAHASQMSDLIDDDPDGFRFTPETLAPFLEPVETVFEVPL